MKQYMLILRGGNDVLRSYSPEQIQKVMGHYFAWTQQLRDEGRFVAGEPLNDGGRVLRANGQGVVDGPFVETKEDVGGFYVINAENYDEAITVSKGCPTLTHGGVVELREVADMTAA